jgi:hypothetical protein
VERNTATKVCRTRKEGRKETEGKDRRGKGEGRGTRHQFLRSGFLLPSEHYNPEEEIEGKNMRGKREDERRQRAKTQEGKRRDEGLIFNAASTTTGGQGQKRKREKGGGTRY